MGVNVLVKRVLEGIGISPARYNLQWASAAEAPRFVKLITEFTKKISELGPLGQAEGIKPDELQDRINKAVDAGQQPEAAHDLRHHHQGLAQGQGLQ